ncbi:hypothetical protein [Salinimicrobium sp. GXAS 041]|uniref:hypothetical protein n=1 Tax=Salinimicrobium sp. GXAS 041 TaxID=3400806 RepID=UPI003C78A463
MVIKIRTISFFFALSILLNLSSYGQFSQHPPAPMAQDNTGYDYQDCADEVEDDPGSGLPPPPALCMPIDDYLLPLLFAGVLLGAYKMRKFEQI